MGCVFPVGGYVIHMSEWDLGWHVYFAEVWWRMHGFFKGMNFGSDNGLAPEGTKPLHETISTYCQLNKKNAYQESYLPASTFNGSSSKIL